MASDAVSQSLNGWLTRTNIYLMYDGCLNGNTTHKQQQQLSVDLRRTSLIKENKLKVFTIQLIMFDNNFLFFFSLFSIFCYTARSTVSLLILLLLVPPFVSVRHFFSSLHNNPMATTKDIIHFFWSRNGKWKIFCYSVEREETETIKFRIINMFCSGIHSFIHF